MPYSRQRPRIPASGRVSIRLSTSQRDSFIGEPSLPRNLGHALHRSPVRDGKVVIRVTRTELDALIRIAAAARPLDRRAERATQSFLRYLESQEDRFAVPDEEDDSGRD